MSIQYSVFSVVICMFVGICSAGTIDFGSINKLAEFNQAAMCPEQTIDELSFNNLELNGLEMLMKVEMCAENASKNNLKRARIESCFEAIMPTHIKFLQCHEDFIRSNADTTEMSEIENNLDKQFVRKMFYMSYDITKLRQLIDDQQLFNIILGKFPADISQQSSNQINEQYLTARLASFITNVIKIKAY